jgi:hypothetical protein
MPETFYPMEGDPGTHSIGGLVGPGENLVAVENREICYLCQELNLDSLIIDT